MLNYLTLTSFPNDNEIYIYNNKKIYNILHRIVVKLQLYKREEWKKRNNVTHLFAALVRLKIRNWLSID